MPSDSPRPPQRAWRKNVSADTKTDALRRWQRPDSATAKSGGGWSWKAKAGVGIGLVAVLGFGLIWLISQLWPPRSPYLVVIGHDYQENLAIPHNVYGWRGATKLVDWAKDGASSWFGRRQRPQPSTSSLKPLEVDWSTQLPTKFREDSLVLYLAFHGGADPEGPFLYLNDPPAGYKRLRIQDVLDALAKPELKDKKKLLILDATQAYANWPSGMLHNTFAEELMKMNENIRKVPNLVVLSASAKNQQSWTSEERGTTIFGHYVLEGIKGAADDSGNNHVTALELHKYVSREVRNWASNNRSAVQLPQLLPADEGKEIAAGITLSVREKPYQAPKSDGATDLARLTPAWQAFEQLRGQSIPPAVFSPHRWRVYIDTLLRYEEVVRAGGDRVGELQQSLVRLQDELKTPHIVSFKDSEWNSLSMPIAMGKSLTSDPIREKAFQELWDAPEKIEPWNTIPNRESAQVAWHLSRFVRDKLLADGLVAPAKALENATKLLGLISRDRNVLPAETHSLAVMLRDMSGDLDPLSNDIIDTLKLRANDIIDTLKLRAAVEELALSVTHGPGGYACGEQVFRWIKSEVEKCDQERRLGEDLLMSSADTEWKKSRGHRAAAEAHRLAAADIAKIVRNGYHTRDRVLSELPYYSQWLVRRHLNDQAPSQRKIYEDDVRRLLAEAEKAWKSVHDLARTLEKPNPDGAVNQVAQQTKEVDETFAKLKRGYDDFKEKIPRSGDSQRPWLEIQDALALPFVPVIDRLELLVQSRRISQSLNSIDQPPPGGEERDRDLGEFALLNAERNYRIAWATMGEAKLESTESLAREMALLRDDTERKGEDVAKKWQSLLALLPNASTKPKPTLEQARAELTKIELHCRQIDGAGIQSRGGLAEKNDPMRALWQIRMHDLLDWQADRTIEDHWFSRAENADAKPYYRSAAARYLEAAKEHLAEAWRESVTKEISDLDSQRAQLKFAPQGSPINVIKEQPTFKISATLQQDGKVPPGFPMLWLQPLEKQKILTVVAEQDQRLPSEHAERGIVGTESELKFPITLSRDPNIPDPTFPEAKPARAIVECRYRGQILTAPIDVRLHLRPDVAARRRVPKPDCGVAVVADESVKEKYGAGNSAIAIVLDCSGSMNYPKGTRDRFDQAINAIKVVLKDGVRKDTEVSFWLFGHEENNKLVKRVWDGPLLDPIKNERRYYTVGQLNGTPMRWDPAGVNDFIEDRVRRLTPTYHTAAVKAVMAAKAEHLDNFKGRGFKTLLLVTDGADNHFNLDTELNKGESKIGEFLRKKFTDSGIQLHVVGFDFDKEKEKEEFRDQFEAIKAIKPFSGILHDVRNEKALAAQISRSLKQELTFKVEEGEQNEVVAGPRRVATSNEQPRVADLRESKPYRVHLDQYFKQVRLDDGDVLFVRAKEQNQRVVFERFLFTDYLLPNRNVVMKLTEVGGWRLAVLQNQRKGDQPHEMFVTLEEIAKLGANEAEDLRQIHPEFVWFEVTAEGTNQPLALRWKNEPYYPAPAWSIEVQQLPKRPNGEDAVPVLRAWWRKTRPPAEFALAPKSSGNLIDKYRNGSEEVNGVNVEGVEFLSQQPGFEKPCLVVRLRHAEGKPALAKLENLTKKYDVEHRVYHQANVTVTIYWNVTESELNRNEITLSAISLEEFKANSGAQAPSGRHEENLWAEMKIPPSAISRPPAWMTPKAIDDRNP